MLTTELSGLEYIYRQSLHRIFNGFCGIGIRIYRTEYIARIFGRNSWKIHFCFSASSIFNLQGAITGKNKRKEKSRTSHFYFYIVCILKSWSVNKLNLISLFKMQYFNAYHERAIKISYGPAKLTKPGPIFAFFHNWVKFSIIFWHFDIEKQGDD